MSSIFETQKTLTEAIPSVIKDAWNALAIKNVLVASKKGFLRFKLSLASAQKDNLKYINNVLVYTI